MSNVYSVPLSELVEEFHLEKLYESSDYHKIHVTVDDVSRPGLYLAGFFDHFEPMRLYVCGTVESAYLEKLSSEERRIILTISCPTRSRRSSLRAAFRRCRSVWKWRKAQCHGAELQGHDLVYRIKPHYLPQTQSCAACDAPRRPCRDLRRGHSDHGRQRHRQE